MIKIRFRCLNYRDLGSIPVQRVQQVVIGVGNNDRR